MRPIYILRTFILGIFFLHLFDTGIKGQISQIQYGEASYYADSFQGKKTANGETYRHNEYTAAHKDLPFDTWVRVTNLANGNSVLVRINDRGPFVNNRIIDLSKYAARDLDMLKEGVANVKMEVLPRIHGPEENNQTDMVGDERRNPSNYYRISVNRAEPEGFGVQIRSLRGLENLLKESEHWSAEFNAPIFVKASRDDQGEIFKIIAGEFKTRKEAEKFQGRIRNDFPDCFVIEF